MQTVLSECFERAVPERTASAQRTLRRALSCYYSGNFMTGFEHGYVAESRRSRAAAPSRPTATSPTDEELIDDDSSRSAPLAPALALAALLPQLAAAQGFDKINTTVTNVNAILVTISIAVVTIAIIWAGFKMIFQGARLADVANVLIGGTLIGGAAAFASYIVT